MATRCKDETFLKMAEQLSELSTCARRQVGCILTNSLYQIIGSGYNGVHRGAQHCIESNCSGAGFLSGAGLEMCEAIHAEQNALMQCFNVNLIDTAYVTHFPCEHCIKMLLNTSCQRIVYRYDYSHTKSYELWKRDKLRLIRENLHDHEGDYKGAYTDRTFI